MSKNEQRLKLHALIAFTTLTLVGVWPTLWFEFDLESGLAIIFMVVSQISFTLKSFLNATYNGYGVAEKVNALVGVQIMPQYTRAWRGYALVPLTQSWAATGMSSLTVAVIAIFFFLHPEKGELVWVASAVLGAFAIGRLCGLCAEVYLWLMADCYRHWYLYESRLRTLLRSRLYSEIAIDCFVDEARKRGLLVDGR